jgi:hypothetical protein
MWKVLGIAVALAVTMSTHGVWADDLTGRDRLLCSAGTVTACSEDGDCFKGIPFDFNIPEFVEVDLQAKRLSTTEASGENRTSPITHLKREDGVILLQGFEAGRAFSFLINEAAGLVTVAITADGITMAIYGTCTPMPESK